MILQLYTAIADEWPQYHLHRGRWKAGYTEKSRPSKRTGDIILSRAEAAEEWSGPYQLSISRMTETETGTWDSDLVTSGHCSSLVITMLRHLISSFFT